MKCMLLGLLLPCAVAAQSLPDSTVRKIDEVFKTFTAATPGCAVAIAQGGAVTFQKGYGLANLEYAIPNTPQTIFHIASESKQYVAFCILLLEKEGKLSLDDDIRKHLDYVPDLGATITIRHLVYHTSGLRDQWQLLANAGWQLDDVITQDHVIKLVAKQKALNFAPGEEWMYCNTGYTLLAEIVKKVSGLSLRQYAQKNIFEPLEMKDTHFHDNYQEIVPGRAYSYNPGGEKRFNNAVLSYSTVGATSLFTTVLDEVKWLNNFKSGQVGGKDLVEKMLQTGVLNDGRKLNYAFALNVNKYKGWQQIGHGGSDAGYRTFAVRYPEKELGIVVFSNLGSADVGRLASLVADVLITDPKEDPKPSENYFKDSVLLKKITGRFYSERGDLAEFFWKEGQLYRRNPNGFTGELKFYKETDSRYRTPGGAVYIFDDKERAADSIRSMRIEMPNSAITMKRQPAVAQTITDAFAGKYFNPETEAFYYVTFKDGALQLSHRKYATVTLKNIAPDQFTLPFWWMGHIRFLRDKKQKVVGFEVNAGRVQHLRYDKMP
ncbi:serine hydrolase domain-containing protein [Paraflavitalea sp. CAU 1676]|uniref:serine hydrolase domain-containing protein n=1 Tax=Paraflavitalea sp. CAU 1676 TaxID=3032598 RepID=UPI0023DA3C70|nr:serine hydrolase domain-containing protein [Paraflavitalea sp. CAU 1676]MDF2192786.1 serine hydrolase [Paraflavitalea sp. CAU 1676]